MQYRVDAASGLRWTPPSGNHQLHEPPVKVVFLCQRVPYPPDRGDRITTWHILQHCLLLGAEVRVGCFAEEARDAEALHFLRERCQAVEAPMLRRTPWQKLLSLRGLLTGQALTLPFFRHRALQATVDHWLQNDPPDLIFVYSSSMAQHVLDRRGAKKVMHFAELDSDKWRQFAARSGPIGKWLYGREARTLLAFEAEVARDFDRSLVVSDVEQGLFIKQIPGVVPDVLPNGVDVEHFCSAGDARREPHTLVFTGVMDYEPNVDGVCWFADNCWLALREQFPDAKLLIVGSKPLPAVQALAQRPGIEVTGRVATTPPFFDRATIAIAPLRLARGVQNKVLEALSMGLPVVATPQAAQGLGEVPMGVLRIARTPQATIAHITELWRDPARARSDGQAAASFVRAHWRWQNTYARLDALFAQLGVSPTIRH